MPFLILIAKKYFSFFYNINNLNKLAKVKLSLVINTIKTILIHIYTINQRFSRFIFISFVFSFSSLFIYILFVVIIMVAIYNFLASKALKTIVIVVL